MTFHQRICWIRAFLLLIAVGSSSLSHSTPTPGSCDELKSRYGLPHDVPCGFKFKEGSTWNFRSKDARLSVIETQNTYTAIFNNAKMFNGKVYNVYNATEINKLTLVPGDQVILRKSGNWADQNIVVKAAGSWNHPIIIRAEAGVKLTGKSKAHFSGSNLIVENLSFSGGRNVPQSEKSWIVFSLGKTNDPCNSCIVNKLTIEDYNLVEPSTGRREVTYLLAVGANVTISNSLFKDKKNAGKVVSVPEAPSNGHQRVHILNNKFVDRPAPSDRGNESNGYEMLMIGSSLVASTSAFSIIEGNTFERADGELEIITVKISDVIIRENRFLNSWGSLSLRATNRVLVENNIFDGLLNNRMGGVRIIGAGHWVVGNSFLNLSEPTGDEFYHPISLQNADHLHNTSPMQGYAQTKDVVISSNTFLNNFSGIFNGSRSKEIYWPQNVHIINNQFRFSSSRFTEDFVATNFSPLVDKSNYLSQIRFERNPVYWENLNLTRPYIALTNPLTGTSLTKRGTVSVTAYAEDPSGIQKVVMARNGVTLATLMAAPFSFDWDVLPSENGTATWTATAYNSSNRSSVSNPITVKVDVPTPFVFKDSFDSQGDGSEPTGWTILRRSNSGVKIDPQVFSGASGKSAHLYDNSTVEFTNMGYSLTTATQKGMFKGAYKFPSTDKTHFVFLGLGDKGLMRLLMASQGRWMSSDGVKETVLLSESGQELRYVAGVWYHIEIHMDFTKGSYRVKVGSEWAKSGIIPGQNTRLSGFRIQPVLRESIGDLWVDDIYFEADPLVASMASAASMDQKKKPIGNTRAYPVPFRRGHGTDHITFDQLPIGAIIKIFTVSGELIKTLTAESDKVTWDVRNESGNPVPSGVYMVAVDKEGTRESLKVVVLK